MRDSVFLVSLVVGMACAGAGCETAPSRVLPRCADGQGLTTDKLGALVCTSPAAPYLPIQPPAEGCPDGQGLGYFKGTDQLSCVTKEVGVPGELDGDALRRQLDMFTDQVAILEQAVAQLRTLKSLDEPLYVGNTSALTKGRISAAGKTGLAAATVVCSAEFGAGAAMCTPFQLTRSVARGKLGVSDRIPSAWVYMPTWHNPKSSTTEPMSGLADNCGGYSTGIDDSGWTGMAVEWGPLASGDVAFRWHGGDEAPCSASLPIACCAGASR